MLSIPVAIKLSPFYTALPAFAQELERTGIDGLVLFNRFYQADINIETLENERTMRFSDPGELLLRLRWLAILSSQTGLSYAVSGGVHSVEDAIKAAMAGAHTVQVVSALLREGPQYLKTLQEGFNQWMDEHEYDSFEELRGCMSYGRCPDPLAYERANYIQILQGWWRHAPVGEPNAA